MSKGEPSQDVPIFLRKTYDMVDKCDPAIASWSEDGETFVVKDPDKFERTIIPQYFKHSKFSSFVRQLNFYSFRKIKYVDTIRIDPKLEAETANYWRFRHEKFRRGHPEMLTEIKRMNGQKGGANANGKQQQQQNAASVSKDDATTKQEVQSLKQRIDEMTKNIDALTAMVQKVSLNQDQDVVPPSFDANVGAKRKKTNVESDHVLPDDMPSAMDLDELAMPMPAPLFSAPREASTSTNATDNEFVEQLFSTFNEDEGDFLGGDEGLLAAAASQPLAEAVPLGVDESNRPDPELMRRLSDALTLLPRDIQVMIVDRLIASITNTGSFTNEPEGVSASKPREPEPKPEIVVSVEGSPSSVLQTTDITQTDSKGEMLGDMPLAAATLAALLHHYSSQVKSQQSAHRTIPVVPVHA